MGLSFASKETFAYTQVMEFSPVFASTVFIMFAFIFKSMLHLKLICFRCEEGV